jgi:uncharacterized protein
LKRATVEYNTILLAKIGSHAYGTNTPESDLDIKGVCIAPLEYYLGFKEFFQKDDGWDNPNDPPSGLFPILEGVKDCCIYELRKFIKLAASNNPTILEMLWLNDYEYLSPVGKNLVNHRQDFLSKRVKHSYSGYAYAQLRKVESHRRWLLDPPTRRPEASDFGIDDNHQPLTKEQMGAFLEFLYVLVRDNIEFMEPANELRKLLLEDIDFKGIIKQKPIPQEAIAQVQDLTRASNDYMRLLQSSQAYRKALNEWESYQQWKKNRNPERAKLEAKCGFDGKHASHSVRLLRQGDECLRLGRLIVSRKDAGDAEELLAIRKGEYQYEDVLKITQALFNNLEDSYKQSTLPHHIDEGMLNDLCVRWVNQFNS